MNLVTFFAVVIKTQLPDTANVFYSRNTFK